MTKKELEIAVSNLWITADSREHINEAFKERIKELFTLCGGEEKNKPERVKLDFGDYSAKTILADGSELDLSNIAIVERKESLAEAIGNFTTHKERFEREFTRAQDKGAKIHLLIENGSYTKLYKDTFDNHPFVNGNSLRASFWTLVTRYDITIHFCKPEQTARVIYDILTHELTNYLEPKNAHRFEVENEHRRTKKKPIN